MTTMVCNCCGTNEASPFFGSDDNGSKNQIVQCKSCGLLYVYPQPTLKELRDLYEGYEIESQWERGMDFLNREIFLLASKVTPPNGTVLEVGCAYGKILTRLHQKGFRVKGVEPSQVACNYINKNYSFDVFKGFIEDYLEQNMGKEIFNTVIALNVIEHLQDPYGTLLMIDGILKTNGHILIVVPDIGISLLLGKIKKILGCPDPYGLNLKDDRGPVAFNSPGHLYFFSRETLAFLCKRLGWEVILLKHAPYALSGKTPPHFKDRIKPIFYYFAILLEKMGLQRLGVSYSQLLMARKR